MGIRPGASRRDPSAAGRRARFGYWFDNHLASGTRTLINLLGVGTIALVALAAIVIRVGRRTTSDTSSLLEGFWSSLLRSLDPGTMGSDNGWPYRVVSLSVTIGGILIVSALIGLVATGLDQRLTALRRGRSMIVESGHVLVLGWTPKLFTLLGELDEANANQARPLVVVVLAIDDKMTMDTALHDLARQYRSLRIVCRTGDSGDIGTLRTVAAERSKAIVVLSRPHDGDPHAVRTVLALDQLGLPRETTVVVELLEESRVRALRSAADIPFVPIVARDWIARIVAHVCRTPGLGAVYRDLLDFAGDEIYFESIPARLSGLRYLEVVARCLHGAAIGVVASDGDVELAPPPDRLLVDGDRLVVLAEDDGTVRFADLPVAVAPGDAPPRKLRAPDHVGVLGWNGLGINVLKQFDEFLPPDSSIELVCDERSTSRAPLPTEPFQRFQLRHRFADTTDPDELARLVGSSTPDCLLILNGHEELGVHSADARVLLAMLETRHMLDAGRTLQVVAEFADPSNTRLAGPERSEEFIVGEQLTALLIAQVVENPALVGVFSDLVDADGVDIDVVGVEAFVAAHEMLTFRELAFRAATHRHAAIGTRAPDGTVTVNPPSDRQVPTDPGTQLVVLRHLSEGR